MAGGFVPELLANMQQGNVATREAAKNVLCRISECSVDATKIVSGLLKVRLLRSSSAPPCTLADALPHRRNSDSC